MPTGYSFNLDGTNIYLTLATLFIAQALGVELSLYEQLAILAVAMLILVFGSAILDSYGKRKAERTFAEAHPGCMLRIGKLELDAPFFQAGLAGYSDAAMRLNWT